jgi:hypothetical protein
MALRISLILAVLAGLGVIGVSQFVLRPHVEEIITTRDSNKKGWDDAEGRFRKKVTELNQTQTKLTSTEKTLEETKTQLGAMTAKADSQEKRANGLDQQLTQTKASLKTAQDRLEQWRLVGLEPAAVIAMVASEKKLQRDVAGLREENAMFSKKVKQLEIVLEGIRGGAEDNPHIPSELRGKVTVVDPKWDFVVLDVGSGKGLPPRGVLLVSRNGELVAKVRVMSVEEQRAIANVMPGWKLKDIMEGDAVLPY